MSTAAAAAAAVSHAAEGATGHATAKRVRAAGAAAAAPSTGEGEGEGEGEADIAEALRAVFPYTLLRVPGDASDDDKRVAAEERARLLDVYKTRHRAWVTRGRIPPDDPDFVPRPRWKYLFATIDEAGEDDTESLVMLLQQRFMSGWASHNHALLGVWLRTFRVVFGLGDRAPDHFYLAEWSSQAFHDIRDALLRHPQAADLTNLLSMLPMVERGLHQSSDDGEEEGEDNTSLTWNPWKFYQRMFMPGSDRVGVPMPVGLVLFEGKTIRPSAADVLRDRLRRAPFSTSWHLDVALGFATGKEGTLLVHKLMSDGILGIDMQQVRGSDRTSRLGSWNECEIVVQPLVSFHLVQEADVLLDRWEATDWVHVVFTHAFLGDVCPCEAQKEAAASSSSDHTPKRQRLQGRLQLD